MNEKTTHWIIVGGMIVILAVLFWLVGERQIILSTPDQLGKITVTGEAETDVMPDKALLYLTILTEGKDAKTVQQENAKKMNQVKADLKTQGIEDTEIETSSYNLYPWDELDQTASKLIHKGYRAQHTLAVTITKIDTAGKIIDTAVQSGVNTIDNIQFTLSDQLEKKTKEQLVAHASSKAKQKAATLASNLDVSLGKVLSISESSYSPPIYYAS